MELDDLKKKNMMKRTKRIADIFSQCSVMMFLRGLDS